MVLNRALYGDVCLVGVMISSTVMLRFNAIGFRPILKTTIFRTLIIGIA